MVRVILTRIIVSTLLGYSLLQRYSTIISFLFLQLYCVSIGHFVKYPNFFNLFSIFVKGAPTIIGSVVPFTIYAFDISNPTASGFFIAVSKLVWTCTNKTTWFVSTVSRIVSKTLTAIALPWVSYKCAHSKPLVKDNKVSR